MQLSPLLEQPVSDVEGEMRRSSKRPEWLLRVSIESLLIVVSILLALAMDGVARSDAEA